MNKSPLSLILSCQTILAQQDFLIAKFSNELVLKDSIIHYVFKSCSVDLRLDNRGLNDQTVNILTIQKTVPMPSSLVISCQVNSTQKKFLAAKHPNLYALKESIVNHVVEACSVVLTLTKTGLNQQIVSMLNTEYSLANLSDLFLLQKLINKFSLERISKALSAVNTYKPGQRIQLVCQALNNF